MTRHDPQDRADGALSTQTEDDMKAYKGFDKDFKCRGFQYEVGKTYEHDGDVVACESGFHACENPFDVWNYYSPLDSRFAEVTLSGAKSTDSSDSKIAAAKITITSEIGLGDFVKKCVNWLIDATKDKSESGHAAQLAASGHAAQLAASGNSAQLAASGNSAQLAASGNSAQLAASGNYAQLAASGYSAQLAASGGYAKLAASGNYAQLAASGNYAQLAASGHAAQLAASGYSAQLAASGENSLIASASIGAIATGAVGTWISLAEFKDGKCVGFATGCIGQNGLKPGTPYCAKGGKLVEVQ